MTRYSVYSVISVEQRNPRKKISTEYAERAEIRNFTGRNTTASYLIILVLTPRIPASGGLVFQRRNFDQRRLAISDMSGSGKA